MKKKQRFIAKILVVIMCVSLFPFSTFAVENEDSASLSLENRSGNYNLTRYEYLYNEYNEKYIPDQTYVTAPVYNQEIFNIIDRNRNSLAGGNPLGSISMTNYVWQRYWSGPYGLNSDPSIGGLYIPGGVYYFSDAEDNGDMYNMMQKFESFNGRSVTHSLVPGYSYYSKSGGSWFVNFQMRDIDDRIDFFYRLNPDHLNMFFGAELKGGAQIVVGGEVFSGNGDKTFSTEYDINDKISLTGGSSGIVSEPWFMLIDNIAPSIVGIDYRKHNSYGEEFIIEFDEYIRTANFDITIGDGAGEGSVTFAYADKNSGTEIGTFEGTLRTVYANKMYFTVPGFTETIAGKEIIITKIEDWGFEEYLGDDALDFHLYGMVREPEITTGYHNYFETGNKSWPWMVLENYANTAYSDLAGNSMDFDGESLSTYNLVFDERAPTLESVSLIHDKVSVDSSVPKDEWPEDINRGNLFLANGETFDIMLQFSEQVSSINKDNVQIELNILGDNGQPVVARPENVEHHEDYAIVSGFSLENSSLPIGTDEPIHIEKITYNVSDLANNSTGNIVLTGDDVPKPREQLYIDTIKPEVNIAYIADATGGEGFTASIDFADPAADGQSAASVSGILGKKGLVWLSTKNNAESLLSYSYAVTDSIAWPSESEFTGRSELGDPGTLSSSPYSIPIEVTGNTKYLHVEFDVIEDAVMVEPRVSGSVTDWAGNKSNPDLSYATMSDVIIDTNAPIITETSAWSRYAYDGNEATITYRFAADHKFDYTGAGEITVVGEWNDGSDSVPTMVGDEYEFEKSIDATGSYSINVTAVDGHGNESTYTSSVVAVDFTKPSANYEIITGTNEPVLDPAIKVTAPIEGDGDAMAYTRVRIGFAGNSYMTVLKTGESIENIFDIDERQWYYVGDEIFYYDLGHTFKAATQLPIGTSGAPSELANLVEGYNGIIEVQFDHAFVDLTPVSGASIDPMIDGGVHPSYQLDNKIFVKKLSTEDNIHDVDFGSRRPYDSNSAELENVSSFSTFFGGNSLVGSYAEFSIENENERDWSIEGVDFENSYVEVFDVHNVGEDGAPTLIETRPLLESAEQKLVFSHETDGIASYTFSVTIANMGGGTSTIEAPYHIIVDNHTPKYAGNWKTTFAFDDITFGSGGNNNEDIRIPDQVNTNGNVPFAPMIVNIAESNAFPHFVSQNDEYAELINTSKQVNIELYVDSNHTVTGFMDDHLYVAGVVKSSRMWNAEQPGEIPAYSDNQHHPEYGLSRVFNYSSDRVVNTVAELRDKSEDPMIVNNHVNIMNYQFMFENGNESPVYEIVIDTRDVQEPQFSLNIEPTLSNRLNLDNEMKLLYSADLYVDSIFTPIGNASLYAVSTLAGGAWEINGDGVADGYQITNEIKYGDTADARDVVTLNKNLYENYERKNIANRDDLEAAIFAFIATDKVGNLTVLVPQFGDPEFVESFPVKYAFDDVVDENVRLYEDVVYEDIYLKYAVSNTRMPISMNLEKTTISVAVDGIEYTYPALNPKVPNEAGFIGMQNYSNSDNDFWTLTAQFALPFSDDPSFEKKELVATVNAVGENEQSLKIPVEFDVDKYKVMTSSDISITGWNGRITTNLVGSLDGVNYYQRLQPPIYKAGTYDIPYFDYFGEEHTVAIRVDENTPGFSVDMGQGLNVTYSTQDITTEPVTVTISAVSGVPVTIDENSNATYTGNGTTKVEALVTGNTILDVNTTESDGVERELEVRVTNIKPEHNPTIVWDYVDSDISTLDHNSNPTSPFIYGSVTATVVDEAWGPVDFFSGNVAEHTFYPNDATSHTFQLKYPGNDEAVEVTATISGFELRERPTLTLPDEEEYVDQTAPSIQLIPFVSTNGALYEEKPIALKLEAGPVDVTIDKWIEIDDNNDGEPDRIEKTSTTESVIVNNPLTEHLGYTNYASGTEFIKALGWGTNIRLQIEVSDEDDVDLVLRAGSYPQNPTYGATDDIVNGVRLSGKTLDISQNAEFTLFAVDKSGNATPISLNFASIGDAPVPTLVKTFPSVGTVRVYLTKNSTDAFTGLSMSDTVKTGTETGGEYTGYDYVDITKNGTTQIPYKYTYSGSEINGVLTVYVIEIDTTKPSHIATLWSANRDFEVTNKIVTATLEFTKDIADVGFVGDADETVAGLEAMVAGKRVTLRYSQNAPAISLVYKSANGLGGTVTLEAVDNIDTILPTMSHSISTDAEKRVATITLTPSEEVVLSELGKRGGSFVVEVTKNGTYNYNFVDIAGNKGETYSVTIDDLKDDPLELSFSFNSSGTNPTTDATSLSLAVGNTLYISANRACEITVNDETQGFSSDWIGFKITSSPTHIIYAEDDYGYTQFVWLKQVTALDISAPVLNLTKTVVSASIESTEEELRALLISNAQVRDNLDNNPIVEVSFTKPSVASTVVVNYTATDASDNVSEKTAYLKLYDGEEPDIRLNGEAIYDDYTFTIDRGEKLELTVDLGGEPYSVMYEEGLKTEAQVKIGSTDIVYNVDHENPITLDITDDSGFYTFVVTAQNRTTFRFIVYVR